MKLKEKINLENLLIIFIILCPILDIASFLFRNKFNTNISISTVLRPIIPIIVFICIFFKEKSKNKIRLILIGLIYLLYGIAHLFLYNKIKTGCTYGTIIHEAQYIVNYSFMILNLYIYNYVFKKENCLKLNKAILISSLIYIISIYIAIVTKTSSSTYIEKIGYKGWFESGNSLGAILVISSFILMSNILKLKNNKVKIITFSALLLIGIYLMTLIGTRVGLLGFIVLILSFIISEFFCKFIKKTKIDKKNTLILISILALLIVITIVASSATVSRRKHLSNMENTIIDASTGEISHLTGDLTVIRNKIINNELEDNYMSKEQKQSVLNLYNIASKKDISNTDTRKQQLIYHTQLVKNQKNILLILFGNGYLANTNELVWEMEFPAILLNFGIVGFSLYMMPFVSIVCYAIIVSIKNIKKIDSEIIMLIFATLLAFVLSTLSGYTFFNSSSMIIIIVANVLLKIKINEIRGENN